MPARVDNVLLTGLDQRLKGYQRQFKACRRQFSAEAVHDLRVSARRLLGALDIIRSVDSHRGVQKTRRELKNLLDHLDELRDVQVLLAEVSQPPEPWTPLSLFHAHLARREQQLLRRARRKILASKPFNINKQIKKMRVRLAKQAREEGFPARVLQAADNFYVHAVEAAARIDAQQSTGLHRARIVFKRFRYVAEIIAPLAPDYPQQQFKRMHDHQSAMGDIRDVEILLGALTDYSQTLPRRTERESPAFDEEPIRRAYEKRHGDLIAAFIEHRSELSTFWRATPEKTFPWEKTNDPLHHSSRHRLGAGPARLRRTRQRAPSDGHGPQQDATDRNGIDQAAGDDRHRPEQSVPARDADSAYPGEKA